MKHPVSSAITGAALVGAVGTTAYALSSKSMKSQRRQLKRSIDKTMKNVGHFMSNVSYLMK